MKLKPLPREVDIPALIAIFLEETKCTRAKLAEISGLSESNISKILKEDRPADGIAQGIRLFLLYLKYTEKDIPLVGEHYESKFLE